MVAIDNFCTQNQLSLKYLFIMNSKLDMIDFIMKPKILIKLIMTPKVIEGLIRSLLCYGEVFGFCFIFRPSDLITTWTYIF